MSKVFTELLQKRSELAARLADLSIEITKIEGDLSALDRVLALWNPDYQATTTKPRKRSGLGLSRGELTEGVLEALRDAGDPLTVALCTEELLRNKKMPLDLVPKLKANVGSTLAYLAKRNRVRRVMHPDGHSVLWGIS